MSSNSPLIWVTIILINCWKEVGWNAIIYLSAMAGIDPGLYEAADMDVQAVCRRSGTSLCRVSDRPSLYC